MTKTKQTLPDDLMRRRAIAIAALKACQTVKDLRRTYERTRPLRFEIAVLAGPLYEVIKGRDRGISNAFWQALLRLEPKALKEDNGYRGFKQ